MRASILLPLLCLACKPDADDSANNDAYAPDLYCPGDPSGICDAVSGAALEAGAARVSIVPSCFESWTDKDGDDEYDSGDAFHDCGCDRLCQGDEGWTAADQGEGDGEFQAVWIAGFGQGRAATGVRGADMGLRGENDGLWASTVVLRQGETSMAIVALDLVGFFNDDVLAVRRAVAEAGLDVDHVLVQSSHNHEGPDTMGMWGPNITTTGVDPDYEAELSEAIVASIEQALDDMRQVSLTAGQADAGSYHAEKGLENLVRDSRDPWIVDERLGALRLQDDAGDTVATLVSWGNHPEATGSDNTLLTSDFAHALRETVESGVSWKSYQRAGLGGICLFVNSTVGGLMTPLGIEVEDPDGNAWSESSFEKADALGQLLGEMALDALEQGEQAADPQLAFKIEAFEFPVENYGFQAMMNLGVFAREVGCYDPEQDIDEDNQPCLASEVNVADIGPVQLLTVPGELLPEVAIGGYDGSHMGAPQQTLVDDDNPNPPDLEAAPAGPYLVDLMSGDFNWIVGLGNDEVGYMIPSYDFVLHESGPWLMEAEGDHYEETNSIGQQTVPIYEEQAELLLAWQP